MASIIGTFLCSMVHTESGILENLFTDYTPKVAKKSKGYIVYFFLVEFIGRICTIRQ